MAETSKKSVAEKTADQVSQAAGDMGEKLADKARTESENLRDAAADEAQKAANAADAASSEFDPNSMQAQAIDQVAAQIENIAEQIRSTDIDRLARTVRNAAERNPLMFLAGATVVGFAAARFLKSRPSQGRYAQDYGNDHGHDDPWSHDTRGSASYGATTDHTSRGSI